MIRIDGFYTRLYCPSSHFSPFHWCYNNLAKSNSQTISFLLNDNVQPGGKKSFFHRFLKEPSVEAFLTAVLITQVRCQRAAHKWQPWQSMTSNCDRLHSRTLCDKHLRQVTLSDNLWQEFVTGDTLWQYVRSNHDRWHSLTICDKHLRHFLTTVDNFWRSLARNCDNLWQSVTRIFDNIWQSVTSNCEKSDSLQQSLTSDCNNMWQTIMKKHLRFSELYSGFPPDWLVNHTLLSTAKGGGGPQLFPKSQVRCRRH